MVEIILHSDWTIDRTNEESERLQEESDDLKKTTELEVISSAYAYAMTLKRKKRMDKRNIKSLLKQNVALQHRLEELKRECPNFKLESDPE